MINISDGDRILVAVAVEPGAFPRESLISLDTIDGPLSGFISSDQIVRRDGDTFVEGVVLDVTDSFVIVNVAASFFTTTGRAKISPHSNYLLAA